MFVNRVKVGQAVYPIERPGKSDTEVGDWKPVAEQPRIYAENALGERSAHDPPYIMIGCHRNSEDADFRDFSHDNSAYDELAIWTRKLVVNRTHDETLYFTGGYCNFSGMLFSAGLIQNCQIAVDQFEGVSQSEWFKLLDQVELDNPAQAEVAAYVSAKYANADSEEDFGNGTTDGNNSTGLNDGDPAFGDGFPRTEQQQIDYERQMIAYNVNVKLLSTAAVKQLERPKYLSRRLVSFFFIFQRRILFFYPLVSPVTDLCDSFNEFQ